MLNVTHERGMGEFVLDCGIAFHFNIAVAILIRTVLLGSMTLCHLSTVNCQHQKRTNLTGYSYI